VHDSSLVPWTFGSHATRRLSTESRRDYRVLQDLRLLPRRRANLHLGAEHLLDSSSHLFVGQELAPIELVQPFFDLLPEPYVMVHVVFDELLDVFSRAAVVLFRSTVNARLQLRI